MLSATRGSASYGPKAKLRCALEALATALRHFRQPEGHGSDTRLKPADGNNRNFLSSKRAAQMLTEGGAQRQLIRAAY